PVHGRDGTVSQRRHEYGSAINIHELPFVLVGADGLNDSPTVQVAVGVDISTGDEERDAVSQSGNRSAQRPLNVIDASQVDFVGMGEEIRPGREVVADECVDTAVIVLSAVLRYDVHDARLRLPVLRVEGAA